MGPELGSGQNLYQMQHLRHALLPHFHTLLLFTFVTPAPYLFSTPQLLPIIISASASLLLSLPYCLSLYILSAPTANQ